MRASPLVTSRGQSGSRGLRLFAATCLGLFMLIALPGCAYYSFTGATIPGHLNSVAIPLVEDNSASPFTDLDNEITQMLVDRVARRTRLSHTSDADGADAVLRARITRYQNEPTAVAGGDRATLNRVTITVNVTMHDQVEDREMLQQGTFSGFEDYDPMTDGQAGERLAAVSALENIADNIFTSATSDW